QQLHASAGRINSPQLLAPLFTLAIELVVLIALFIVPTFAPPLIDYGNAVEGVASISAARHYVSFNSSADYDRFWSRVNSNDYQRIQLYSYYDNPSPEGKGAYTTLPAWNSSDSDTASHHRPFRFIGTDEFNRGRS